MLENSYLHNHEYERVHYGDDNNHALHDMQGLVIFPDV